ncbi:MAG: hypothetical protein IJP54_09760 [Synergistaceae bacterium]|nr:hypothetical protein [Synergistaceae bacterium]MBR0035950.1 hypothetical protein [Synergistaceae bacterium]
MKKSLVMLSAVLALVLCLSATCALAAGAGDFDFLRFAKEKVLTDFHPTAKLEDATSEFDKEPVTGEDGIVTARVRMFYKGWIRKHEMLSQIELRPDAGLVKVTVLADSNGTNLTGSKVFKENAWVELSSLNWE